MPMSRVSSRPSSSTWASSRSANRKSTFARWIGDRRPQSSNARAAARTARSTSSAPASATVRNTSPVAGLVESNVRPDAAATRAPSITSPSLMILLSVAHAAGCAAHQPRSIEGEALNLSPHGSIPKGVNRTPDPAPDGRRTDATEACRAALEPDLLLEALLDQEAVGITIVDRDLRIVRANRAFGIFGDRTPEQVAGRLISEVLPAIASQIVPVTREVLRDRRPEPGARGRRRRPGRPRELPLVPRVPLAGAQPRGRDRGRDLDRDRDLRPAAHAARARRRAAAPARERYERAARARPLPRDLRRRVDGDHAGAQDRPPRRGEPGDRGRCSATPPPSSPRWSSASTRIPTTSSRTSSSSARSWTARATPTSTRSAASARTARSSGSA